MAKYSQKWHNGTSRTRSTETSDGLTVIQAQLNNLGREIKKVNEKVYAAQVGCEQCKGPHYTKDCPLKEEGKILKEAYYTQFGAPFQQGGQYRPATLGFYQINNANPSYQERRQSMEEPLSHPSTPYRPNRTKGSYRMQCFDAYSFRVIRINDSLPRKEKDLGSFTIPCYINNVCFENALDDFRSSQYAVSAQQNSKLMFGSRQTNIPFPSRLNDCYCNEKNGLYGMQCFDAYSFGATRVDDSLPRKEKDPRSFTLPCYINNVCFENALTDLGASIAEEEDFTKYIRDKIADVKASLKRVHPAIHEMESKSDKDAWKDAIDCFKETKDWLELKPSRLTQLADKNFDGVKELKVHSAIIDLCE
uniref:Uncharacterized protein n=1 Tax=Tanacetum cinerariifolium TaxID=118510 RepID=A0A699H6U0_TANCI|nr:hypothetical protein [Tanacetum cinerariifolium]